MRESMSIWFFAGLLFLAYGVVICATGLWELWRPLTNPPVLNNLHAPIWWGAMMGVAGLAYAIHFWPHKK